MKKAKIIEFHTQLNSMEMFEALKENSRYPFFLDSGMDREKLGRYSFIGVDPFLVIKKEKEDIILEEYDYIKNEKKYRKEKQKKIFQVLEEKLEKYKIDSTEIPFVGGGVGYFSYELAHEIEELPSDVVEDLIIPEVIMGFYDGIVIVDHLKGKNYISAIGFKEEREKIIKKINDKMDIASIKREIDKIKNQDTPSKTIVKDREITSNMTKEYYLEAISKLKKYIKSGDIYQVNFTQRFSCDFDENPYKLYKNLREINPAPFAGFYDFGSGTIVSSSPERFVKLKDKIIETRPMKGTRPRGKDEIEDKRLKKELVSSEKDRAELLMIVDLMRNDISRVSESGSVKVPELFYLEEYATVLQMVSKVVGKLKTELSAIDVVREIFPGGSITGAPKIRAMEIINELEPTTRNIYTGSMGYIGFNGNMDLNICIRTIVLKDKKAYFQVGGGIVWDSDPEEEYEESLVKGRALVRSLNKT